MKGMYILIVLFIFAGTATVEAQSCKYAKKSKATTVKVECHGDKSAAALAAKDPNIIQVASEGGEMEYYCKKVCDFSSSVSYEKVTYDEAKGEFVSQKAKDCSAAAKASCIKKCSGAKKSKSAQVSTETKKVTLPKT